jgi:hypothetical protein
MRKKQLISAVTLMLSSVILLSAQDNSVSNSIDTLNSKIEQAESDLTILKKIKFSGYVQAQWQKADTVSSPAAASGGDFKGFDNRFQIRRARLKAAYSGENSTLAVQLDLKDDGSVKVKEAYGIYTEPLLKTFSLTGGFFNRPVGYEVEYSSGILESPERSRITQALFPDEVDLGAKLTIQAPKTSAFNFIKLDVGLFNGNAITSETDNYKDVIAHLSMKKAFLNENLLLSGGFSYYNGGWASPTSKTYKWNAADSSFKQDVSILKGDKLERKYFGLDAQATLNSALGITTIRGEYLWGQQPGTFKTSVSPKGAVTESKDIIVNDTNNVAYKTSITISPDAYIRNFSGGYIYFIHRILQTKHEIVAKYDWYDPNTDAKGNEIFSKSKNSGISDLKFSSIGIGYNYYATANVRLSVYYDMVTNEKASSKYNKAVIAEDGIKNFTKDLKDNILTVRVLYKF